MWWFKQSLPNRIFICIILGIVLGMVFGPKVEAIKPIGDIFVRLVSMMVILLVTPALISGMGVMQDPKKIGRVGIKIVVLFVLTTIVAGVFAIFLGNVFRPGSGIEMAPPEGYVYNKPTQTLKDVLMNIVPKNPVEAFAKGDLLSILFVVLFFGIVLAGLGEKGATMQRFFAEWTDVSMKMLQAIMELAPYAAGALIAFSVGVHGPRILGPLGKFVGLVWLGELLIIIEYVFMLLANGISPRKFVRHISGPAMISFSTCSSMATLGSNVEATKRMGVPDAIATFGITLGNVINMDGTALYQVLAVLFVSQIYGVNLPLSSQIMAVILATVVTISLVGVPGAGTASLGLILLSLGLPVEGVGLVLAVDRLCDMPRTMLNCIGDSMCSIIAAKSEGELDPESPILMGNKS
ncbi:MAG: dicarboxylate/amino acid:cation symporter [Bacillota bacterium]|jgi:proton glutamate symport protein